MMQNLVCTAFLAAALAAEAPQPVSETTTTLPTEQRRKLKTEWARCNEFGTNWPRNSNESGCLAAGCFFIKLSHRGLDDVCEPKDYRPRQQKDDWSKEESPCLSITDDRLSGHTINFGTPDNMVTKADCERACRAQPGATACEWDEAFGGDGEYGDYRGASLGTCKYFTDSQVYDCQSVWFDDEETDDVCYEHYDGNTEWCMVFASASASNEDNLEDIPASAKDDFVGCFQDNTNKARDLPHRVPGTKSYAECKSECSQYEFFGLQWHSVCFCGNSPGSQGFSANCKNNCPNTPDINDNAVNFEGDGGNANCVFRTGFKTPHSLAEHPAGCWKLNNIFWSKSEQRTVVGQRRALPEKMGTSGVSYESCKAQCKKKNRWSGTKRFNYFGRYGNNECYCGRIDDKEAEKGGPFGEGPGCQCKEENNLINLKADKDKVSVCVYKIIRR